MDPQSGTFFTDTCLYYPGEHNTLNRVKNVESVVLAVTIKQMPIKKTQRNDDTKIFFTSPDHRMLGGS